MSLSAIDIFLLDYYDHRSIEELLSEYHQDLTGPDYRERLNWLCKNGYLTIGSPEEALHHLTVPVLKDILRNQKLKLSGKKDVLIQRIIENIPIEKYQAQLPKIYVQSEKGEKEVTRHAAYLENSKNYYGFMNKEIHDMENQLSESEDLPRDVLLALFKKHIQEELTKKNFRNVSDLYHKLYIFSNNRCKKKEALKFLLIAKFIDLSGMDNQNLVGPYRSLEYIFSNGDWSNVDKLVTALNLSDNDLKSLYIEALEKSNLTLPFSYFDKETIFSIIIDELHGKENLFKYYKSISRIPKENDSNYKFYDLEDTTVLSNNIIPSGKENLLKISEHNITSQETNVSAESISKHRKWYDRQGIVWLMLLLLWPLGMFMLYLHREKYTPKQFKYLAVGTFCIWFFFGFINPEINKPSTHPATPTVQTTAASVNTSSGKDNSADSTSSTVKKEAAATSSSAAQTTSATSSAATSNASNTTSKAASGASAIPEASYLGNPNSKKFHRPTCRTIKHPENFVAISSRDEAIADGYTPCGVCKP